MYNFSNIPITDEMLLIISEIDEFKGAWQLWGKMAPDRLSALKKVATIESIGSSTRIEGSKLSDNEVERLLSRLNTQSFRSRDEQEVAGYSYVCDEIFSAFTFMPISENTIKNLHSWLLKFCDKDEFHRGKYKNVPNNIEAFDEKGRSLGVVFSTVSPFDTPYRMEELVQWTRQSLEEKSLHPAIIAGVFTVVFLQIHPFLDGNGRLSRLLTTLILLKAGYAYIPYSSLEKVIEANKEGYYAALNKTQKTLETNTIDWSSWIVFFLRCLQKQKRTLEAKISQEKEFLSLPRLSSEILLHVQEHGFLSTKELEVLTKANRNTLKKHIQILVASNYLKPSGKGKATKYSIPL